MKLSSISFGQNESIPSKYTCEGENISPPLLIEDVPEGAVSLVLIMDDPDVPKDLKPDGMWDHWVIWNIPVDTSAIAEGIAPRGVQGMTSYDKKEYGGPCPPDREHRYFFKLYALDSELDLPHESRKVDVERAMEGHIVEKTELIGLYDKKNK